MPAVVLTTVSSTLKPIFSWQRAATWAACCDFVISSVSCLVTCCWVWPGVKISSCGTTASCGLSQARRAANTLNRLPGPPMKDTVTRLRWPLVG